MKYSQSAFVGGGWLNYAQVYVNRLQFWQVPFMLNEGEKKIKQMYYILVTRVKLSNVQ